jgi:excisionase family DNA binding protein
MRMIEQMYDVNEVAEILGVTEYWVNKWRKQGKIRSLKAGRLVRYSEDEIARFQGIGCDFVILPTCRVNEDEAAIGELAEAQSLAQAA